MTDELQVNRADEELERSGTNATEFYFKERGGDLLQRASSNQTLGPKTAGRCLCSCTQFKSQLNMGRWTDVSILSKID